MLGYPSAQFNLAVRVEAQVAAMNAHPARQFVKYVIVHGELTA